MVFGWDGLFSFLENTTSLACLLRSGLKTFSTDKPTKIVFADPYLVHLLKCYYYLQQKVMMCHLQRVLLLIVNCVISH